MVGGDAEADEAVGDGEGLVHVDFGVVELAEDAVGRVESRWAGADHGEAERAACSRGGLDMAAT